MVDKIMCTEICPCPEQARSMLTLNLTEEEFTNLTLIERGDLIGEDGEPIVNPRQDNLSISEIRKKHEKYLRGYQRTIDESFMTPAEI